MRSNTGNSRRSCVHEADTGFGPAMIVERSMQQEWLSNAYLVGDEPGGTGVIIDSGGPSEPLLEAVERHGLAVEQLLLTHHHPTTWPRTTSTRSGSAWRSWRTRSRPSS